MDGGQGVITSDHDAPVRRIGQHFERLDRVLFQRAMENQKPGEVQVALNLVPLEIVDLRNEREHFHSTDCRQTSVPYQRSSRVSL